MEELTLPVTYQGKELEFPVRIVAQGYVYRFAVVIDGVEIVYEQDEQGELRALLHQPDAVGDKPVDAALIAQIGQTLASLLA